MILWAFWRFWDVLGQARPDARCKLVDFPREANFFKAARHASCSSLARFCFGRGGCSGRSPFKLHACKWFYIYVGDVFGGIGQCGGGVGALY